MKKKVFIKNEILNWWFDYEKEIILYPIIMFYWNKLRISYNKNLISYYVDNNWKILKKDIKENYFI